MKSRLLLSAVFVMGVLSLGSFAQTENVSTSEVEVVEVAEVEEIESSGESGVEVFKKRFAAGKEFSWVMLVLSVFALTCVVERFMNQRRQTIAPLDLSDNVLDMMKEGKFGEAEDLCRQNDSVLALVLRSIIKHRSFSLTENSELAGDVSARELRVHLQKSYPILVVGTVAPLLGLMGTVIGMIGAFESVALAGNLGDPSIMADKISLALITTAMGLFVAVPCLLFYHHFRRNLNLLSTDLDEMSNEVISEWYLFINDNEQKASKSLQES